MMSTMAASNGSARASSSPSVPDDSEPDVVAGARQQRLEDFPHDFLVVDDEDGALLRGSHVSFRSGSSRTPAPPG